MSATAAISLPKIEKAIRTLRGQRVLLDEDLAELYGVEVRVFNQAVKRNAARFPDDFRFQLTDDEAVALRSQIVTSKGRGGRRYLPYAFTQEGVAMLSSVLSSPRAVAVNIEIMRAFVRMRDAMIAHADLLKRLGLIEAQTKQMSAEFGLHKAETGKALKIVFEALRQLSDQQQIPDVPKESVGFKLR
jgi:hypothetical protein